MNLRKNLMAASLAAIPFMLASQALADEQLMAGPLAAPQSDQAALVDRLGAANDKRELDQHHGYA
ncbi:MAG TPA: hypothetical protein VFS02_04445, partial [Telluria sp.]|nr:hypothetical protein [Telluria sp.]